MATLSAGGDAGAGTDQILDTGSALLTDFIVDRVRRHREDVTVTHAQLGGAELSNPAETQVAQSLQRVWDDLDGNFELHSMIDSPAIQPTREVFFQVACQVFSDGTFNWARVVVLFYFAYRLVLKALDAKIPEILRPIVRWTMEFIRDHVVDWIRAQGGWEGIKSYFSTPMWKNAGLFLTGVLATVLVLKM